MYRVAKFVFAAVITLCGVAEAQGPARPGITYDCDTASSHFSELDLPAPSPAFTVSGQVRINQIAAIDKFAPVARVSISGPTAPGEAAKESVGFELSALPAKTVGLKGRPDGSVVEFFSWSETRNDQKKDHDAFGLTETSGTFPFTLIYDGSSVSMQVAGQQQTMPLSTGAQPFVRVLCSTGEFLFTDFRIDPTK